MPVTLIAAMTADGKIATTERGRIRFSSADYNRLEQLCAGMDALVMGAGTLRGQGTTVTIRQPDLLSARIASGRPAQPLTCIVTGRGDLDPALPFFARQEVPRVVATTTAASRALADRLGDLAEVWACGDGATVSPEAVVGRLAAAGCHQLALLGGGELNAAWLAAGLVDQLCLTVSPQLFGGSAAPTVADGPGLSSPPALRLTDVEPVGDDLFLTYQVKRP